MSFLSFTDLKYNTPKSVDTLGLPPVRKDLKN
jgi:hypothetical protein